MIHDQSAIHFVTFTVNQWVDVFTRPVYKDLLIDSLKYCQENKGLQVYAYVIMTNHIHLIISAVDGNLSDIIRDFKKFTSKRIFKEIEQNPQESRKKWMLWALKKDEKVWFWKAGYHGEHIYSTNFFNSKLDYIHANPVVQSIVLNPEDYYYSSGADYYGTRKGTLSIIIN